MVHCPLLSRFMIHILWGNLVLVIYYCVLDTCSGNIVHILGFTGNEYSINIITNRNDSKVEWKGVSMVAV